jgi:hypothetical protein
MAYSDKLEVRCCEEDKLAYLYRCKNLGVDSARMHREIIQAFNSGKLRIIVPKTQSLIIKGLHDVS